MREVGGVIRSHVRTGDLACSHAGEEFVIILHKASVEVSRQRAEQLRGAIEALRFVQGSRRELSLQR